MRRRWRVVLATLCVEAVAVVALLVFGTLSAVAVAVIYWIDLAFVIARVVVWQLVGGETTVVRLPRALPQFRLLEYKRGTLDISEHLPPVYLRSLPTVLFSLSILVASALSTGVVLATSVPDQFWSEPLLPPILAGAVTAAAIKSWLVYTDHVDRNGVANTPGTGFIARKRLLMVLLYAPVMYAVAHITTTELVDSEGATMILLVVSVVILLRVAYGIRTSRLSSNGGDTGRRLDSIVSDGQSLSTPSPPSIPDGHPLETTEPVARSIPAAGFVNALTTGGVVDGEFSAAGLHLRFYSLFVVVPAILAAVTGSSLFQIVTACVAVLAVVFWLLSTVHMELAFGEIEYRFYESVVVAYDRRLREPQWSIPYDNIEAVSVERGLFESPAWLDSGTVTVALTDDTAPIPDTQGRASILFVSEPENICDWVSTRRSDSRPDW